MSIFGFNWKSWTEKIRDNWEKNIQDDDLILIAGDTSWAKRIEDAVQDLLWIDALPGTKILIRGNHDYWWSSIKKMEMHLPPSLKILHNTAIEWKGVGIAGSRLWDSPNYHCLDLIDFTKEKLQEKCMEIKTHRKENERLFERELNRLELSLKKLNPQTHLRIAMTHYPPLPPSLASTPVTCLFEKYQIDIALFGHLHQLKTNKARFGNKNGIDYYLTSCDVLDFNPLQIAEFC